MVMHVLSSLYRERCPGAHRLCAAVRHALCTGDLLFAGFPGKAPNPNPQCSATSCWIPGEFCVGVISTCRPMERPKV